MIDPRRLRVLQAVAAHGSVASAADALRLSPPAVSQQLLALERETGASLIDRAGRQVRLTAAGRLLAAHGELIAAQLRQAERDLAELTGQAAGPVRIAAFQSVMAPLIGPALRDLAAASPAVQPVIAERYGPAAVQYPDDPAAGQQGHAEQGLDAPVDQQRVPHRGVVRSCPAGSCVR
jgi:DNA-binding transcriptional LysR family regulator